MYWLFRFAIVVVVATALSDQSLAAPPASCVNKFVGTWQVTVSGTGQTYRSQIRADGTLTSACPMCPPSQTWTCNGNTFILTSPVSVTHTISGDGRRMAGGCCSLVRIGAGPATAKAPGAAKDDKSIAVTPISTTYDPDPKHPATAACGPPKRESVDWCRNLRPKPGETQFTFQQFRGLACFGAQQYAAAVAAYTEALRAGCPKFTCMGNRARVHVASGDFESAMRDLRETYGTSTNRWGWNYYVGLIAYHKGDLEQAFELANAALQANEADPKAFSKPDPNALFLRGLVKIRKGDRSGGEDDVQTAERVAANNEVLRKASPDGFGKSICHTGLSLEAALKSAPAQVARPAPDVRPPSDARIVDQTESFTRLVAWQSAMKQINVPSVAEHLFVSPACSACRPVALYCKAPIRDLGEMKGKRVGITVNETELNSELSSAGAVVSVVLAGDTYRALETGFVDCVAGR